MLQFLQRLPAVQLEPVFHLRPAPVHSPRVGLQLRPEVPRGGGEVGGGQQGEGIRQEVRMCDLV